MTKKISETGHIAGASKLDSVSSLEQLEKIDKLRELTGISSVGRISGLSAEGIAPVGTRITSENQQEVIEAIDKEAKKLFEGKRIPRQRQKTITDAIKMAVMAATIKDEE